MTRARRFSISFCAAGAALAAAASACSSEDSSSSPTTPPDGGADVASSKDAATPDEASPGPDASADAPSDAGTDAPASGETCIGYGTGTSCEGGLPPYGYVCFGGPPPGFSGCVETRKSDLLGNNYCCPTNDCVAEPDQNTSCNGVSGKPNRFQCPPTGDGGFATPGAGCQEHGSGATPLEKFYCCP